MMAGYRQTASGLIVPAESTRERQVWTKDEWKLLDRATRMLGGHGLSLLLECQHADCKGQRIERMRRPDGTPMLQCPHADRVVLIEGMRR